MPSRNPTYHEQRETSYTLQLRQLLTELPPYARDYFRAAEQKTSAMYMLMICWSFSDS